MTILRKFSIGIIDTSGLKYSHNSVETEFLPPAQTAIINIAESLFEFDFFVTVLNAGQNPGLYNYVNYQPLESLNHRDYQFDIVISVDSVLPFDPNGDPIYQQIQRPDFKVRSDRHHNERPLSLQHRNHRLLRDW